jgi:predicted ATPase/DNA-binding winged helix-turn-helix (wHTH) protein
VSDQAFAFGRFQLLPTRRLLLMEGKPVALGNRALDILTFLVARSGEVVGNADMIAAVWPGLTVEQANLRVHISALRKALGDGPPGNRLIVNIPGRGYSFVAPVDRPAELPGTEQSPAIEATAPLGLPARLTRIIGRTDMIRSLAAQISACRLLTITGPGGIGKTTVAVAAAQAVAGSYRDGVAFVDLGLVATPALVPSAVASALGLALRNDDPVSGLAASLHAKQMLIVLDNCEHMVETAAPLVEALLKGAPGVSILATSRELLRVEGEWVQRMSPLALPPATTTLTADEAMESPAVQLFVERAAASLGGLRLADRDAPIVAEICRRLDGIALAIEFAAGRLDTFTLHELAALLDDRFRVLTRGRRTALPRHQTLRATLDWSYGLLPPLEQVVLCRLSVFNGMFSLAAAVDVATDAETVAGPDGGRDGGAIEECVAGLVAKSLIATEAGDGGARYRMLDTTRAYAREKLEESGDYATFARRHAQYYQHLFARAEREWDMRPTAGWLATYAHHIDNLRAALGWSFAPGGDGAVGVALTVAAVPLWFQLSLVDECLGWVERARAVLERAPDGDERRRMQLHAAIAWPQMFTTTGRQAEVQKGAAGAAPASAIALRLAERLGDADYQLRALWVLWADRINHGDFRKVLDIAERFRLLSTTSTVPTDRLVAERMIGASLHFRGAQAAARERIAHVLAEYPMTVDWPHIVRFQFDQRVTARITLARILWLQGFADAALAEVEHSVRHAASINHVLSLCNALAQAACPVSLLAGDLVHAERYAGMLRAHTAMHALGVWRSYADCFDGEILVRRGDVARGLGLLRTGVDALRRDRFGQYQTAFLLALARGLTAAGEITEAAAVIAEGLLHCERTAERWCIAELQRVSGEIALAGGAAAAAEAAFVQALATARAQDVPAWELRAATSLARLWRDRRGGDATAVLASVYERFSEGFATEDLRDAAAVLGALGYPGRR